MALPVGSSWIALVSEPLPVTEAVVWATTPGCGAVVSFLGVVRDHSVEPDEASGTPEVRTGVTGLSYEAYEDEALARLGALADDARRRWPSLERIVLLHRLGHVELSAPSVLVVAGAPHRDAAFEGARFCIDTLKETAPIWKREHWAGGVDWAATGRLVEPVPGAAPGARLAR